MHRSSYVSTIINFTKKRKKVSSGMLLRHLFCRNFFVFYE